MTIRWSILALFAAIVLTAQSLSYWLTRDVLVATVNERESEKVGMLATSIEAIVADYAESAQLAARALSSSESLAETLSRSNPARFDREFDAILNRLLTERHLDKLNITDDREIVRHRVEDPERHGDRSETWGVSEALQGKGVMVADTMPSGTSVLAIEPLRHKGKIVGTVIAGRHLGNEFIRDLAIKVNADLALASRTKILAASSTLASDSFDSAALEEAFSQKIPVHRSLAEGHVKVVYVPLLIVDEGYVMMVRLDSSAAFRALQKRFAVVFQWTAALLVLSIVAAFCLLRIVLRPLRVLRARAESTAIAATGAPIATGTSDEIGSVVQVLDTLTDRLLAQNREMAQSRAEAYAANAAKSQFLSTMSHEIRTPLNGVLGMAELLHGTALTPEQRKYCEAITNSGRTLHDLLSDILDVSKIEAKKVQVEAIDFDLSQLLEDLSSAFTELAASRRNRLVAEFAVPAPGWFRGDPTRLRQVLTNFLGNAIKFTEGGTITLAAAPVPTTDDSRVCMRFSVRDTGIGIAPEHQKNLFTPFVQADNSTTRRYGGTGLGLVISKHLIELLGGSVHIDSAPGRGTLVWFDLPFDAAQNVQVHRPVAAPAVQHLAARVLLAEDNQVNQQVIKAMLGKAGADVVVVENGELALEALRAGRFDLVLMDCQMPVMDGYEAVKLIRSENAGGRRIPIVALTANAFAEDRERCLAAGMDDYLTKPVKRNVLIETVARWVAQAGEASQSRDVRPDMSRRAVGRA